MPTKQAPATKPYRVCIAGAVYDRFVETVGLDGEDEIVRVRELGLFGQEVALTDREARRLTELGAVKPADEPLSYAEMDDKQLAAVAKERAITVASSGADPAQPLRTDIINALVIYDQGQGRAGQPPAPEPTPPEPGTQEADVPLAERNRPELNKLAASLGVEEPEKLPNKPAVIEAIEAKQAEAAS
jgi:hypothetical protein